MDMEKTLREKLAFLFLKVSVFYAFAVNYKVTLQI